MAEDDPFNDGPLDIQSGAFDPVSVKIGITNSTTKTSFSESGRSYLDEKEEKKRKKPQKVVLIEILVSGFRLSVPQKICAVKHTLLLDVEIQGKETSLSEKLAVKVDSLEATEDNQDLITVSMINPEEKTWKRVSHFLDQEQEKIDEFLTAAKG